MCPLWLDLSFLLALFSRDPFGNRRFRFMERLADDIDQARPAVSQSLFERLAEVFGLGDAPAFHAEGGGHGGVVGSVKVDGEIALAIARLLPRLDPAVGRVRDYNKSD